MAEEANSLPFQIPKRTITIGSSLIPLINKLQEIMAPFSGEGGDLSRISLPQVAVVGSQSSGKSSVLEALVGRDFLPRGCDICTRRPLRLVLEHSHRPAGDVGKEWGEFGHAPGKRLYRFHRLRQEIQAETEKEAGYNKGVSDKEIVLKIFSPNVLNMTLIDLPGITKVPVGDQPSDIETKIRNLAMSYISKGNCIILAVSPANSDLATSDALQIAKEADPQGNRTIGVITKLDIMDRGTNACNFLNGKDFPLRLGYVGVVNRSQEDINRNRTIEEALTNEQCFFHEHPEYSGLLDQCGIPQLAKKLNQILEQHIRIVLPVLTAELKSREDEIVKELQTYGDVMECEMEKGATLLNILRRYSEDFYAMADGKNQEMLTKQLSGGARIRYIFQSVFVKALEALDPCEDLTDEEIRTAIQNATGVRSSLFVPEAPFEVLVRRQIVRLLDPSLQCVKLVNDELLEMFRSCESTDLQRFPCLKKCIDELVWKFLHDGKMPAERIIGNLIEMETGYINSSHPNFLGGNNALELAMKQLQPPQDGRGCAVVDRSGEANHNQGGRSDLNNGRPTAAGSNSFTRVWGIPSKFFGKVKTKGSRACRSSHEPLQKRRRISSTIELRKPPSILAPEITDKDKKEILATKLLLQSYFDIVRKNIQDLVPKAIMHFLVNHTKRNLHATLIQELYREKLFDELLQEQGDTVMRRKHTQETLRILQDAIQMLKEVEPYGSLGSELCPTLGNTSPGSLARIACVSSLVGLNSRF